MAKCRISLLIVLHVVWGIVTGMVTPSTIVADVGKATATHEYQVKAAFLYNFVKFTQWPKTAFEGSNAPIRIAIVGPDRFKNAFAPFLKKTIKGHALEISYHREIDTVADCHVVFFSRLDHANHDRGIVKKTGRPVLTVGESFGFTDRGGIINFVMAEKKIRFEINPDAAEQAGLKISSKLLHLATIVRGGKPTP